MEIRAREDPRVREGYLADQVSWGPEVTWVYPAPRVCWELGEFQASRGSMGSQERGALMAKSGGLPLGPMESQAYLVPRVSEVCKGTLELKDTQEWEGCLV